MKILLVARGSQGDVYPFLAMAKGFKECGHEVFIHLPKTFEKFAKELSNEGISYSLQDDDIEARAGAKKIKMSDMLAWMSTIITSQFEELLPLIERHDMFIVSNTEFAATSLAEYLKKPLIRTAFSPIIPSKKMMPPLTPLTKPFLFVTPSLLWKVIDIATNKIAQKPINKWRAEHGLSTVKNYSHFSYSYTTNLMLYSPLIGSVDPNWAYPWHITSYCFYDRLPYEKPSLEKFLDFIRKDGRPTLFFTTGSIKGPAQSGFAVKLLAICKKHNYKFVFGASWVKIGNEFEGQDDVFVLDSIIPHSLVFEHCTAIIHHGGSGTTHSATRSGKPQLVMPIIIDQFYWAQQIRKAMLGPAGANSKKISNKALEAKVEDLMTNPVYAKNAAVMGEKLRAVNGVQQTIDFVLKQCASLI
ncbi:MAG: glycosyltransferase [Termitinemataceae bacterium]|nr:MAG: glycosyltransferase [Termitinemataceae bacterium]